MRMSKIKDQTDKNYEAHIRQKNLLPAFTLRPQKITCTVDISARIENLKWNFRESCQKRILVSEYLVLYIIFYY